ncbi:RidA family protein [Streptomyces platensis]|nr:RidA family protein [Streptomyces platensis]WTI57202.1 RidA family protein [Streptomyces platensis]WUB84675.1 RidA family protein [Streptomyces platensis]
MPRTTFQPPELFDSRPWGFSQVSVSPPGRIVNIAGQVAWDSNHEVTAVGREAQLRQALKHVLIALEAVGGTADDIQILRLYLPGFESGPEADLIGRVLVDTFGSENPPPSSWIGVQALAQPEYLVEVEAMAVVPDNAAVAPDK